MILGNFSLASTPAKSLHLKKLFKSDKDLKENTNKKKKLKQLLTGLLQNQIFINKKYIFKELCDL